MQPPHQPLTVEPCDICGDVGYREVIVTCNKCNIFQEHVYCMRKNLTEIPEEWICESCQPQNVTTSCKVNQDSGSQASKRRRAVATGSRKTKFLPAEEVIKLSSGNFPVKRIPAKSTLLMTLKTSIWSKNVVSKIPSPTQKSNPCISPMVLGKRRSNVGHKNPVTDQHASCSVSKGLIKEHILENQRLLGRLIPDEIVTHGLQIEKPIKGAPCKALSAGKSSPSVGSGGILCAVAECNGSNNEKGGIQSIPENFNLYCKFLPSSLAAWRGQFQILHAAASCNFFDGFEAHPPCTVKSKAYKFSIRMPSVLQLESLPAFNVLTDVFQNDCPSLQDIALYFFPSVNTERSRKNLNSIFEFMNAEKSVLRSSIDGVELLVFTSNQLNADSRVNAGCFLWGVFCHRKIDTVIERLPDLEPVDMDVDMIGGKDVVGRIDHVLKDKPRNLSKWPLDETHLHSTSKKVEEKTVITSSHLNSCVRDKSALSSELRKNIASEFSFGPSSWNSVKDKGHFNALDNLDPPPGFEDYAKRFPKTKTVVHGEKFLR